MRDVSIKVLPIEDGLVEKMIREIKGYSLIKGYRGEPPKDEKALVDAINNICMLFSEDNAVEFDINPIILYEKGICAVDARIYVSDEATESVKKIEKEISARIFYPRSIAVVGASSDPTKIGYAVFRNLLDFPGELYAVNPKRKEILGHKVYSSLASIPGNVDAAVITIPAALVPQIIDEAGKKGVKLVIVISAGFKEIGDEGRILEDKVLQTAEKYGIRMVGPNCLGVILPHKKINATVAIKSGASKKGQKAASSHTGSLAGSFEIYMAAFKQSGVITVHSLREAFQVGELLASEDYPKGNRAIIISNAGGFAVLSSDYAEKYGVDVIDLSQELLDGLNSFLTEDWSHENPMDLVGDAGADRYARVFDLMIRNQDKWDIAFVVAVPSPVLEPRHLAKEVVRFSNNTTKMIVGCLLGGDNMKNGVRVLREASIPNFSELEDAFKAVGKIFNLYY
jgi:acyl-CoA synthetase (NDP forming)